MALPFATTLITVLRSDPAEVDENAEGDADGYPSAEPTWEPVVSGVRAVISAPGGTFVQAGSLQEVIGFRLAADPCDLQHSDRVLDETDQQQYVVEWMHHSRGFGLDHMSAKLRVVEGFQ